ncbi:hypothetical protein ACI3EY_16575 [Ornithinimicrobium sp. LYQ92]|uniref:hypothetical protein n=1 Tax=Serinicoccus sp. LYQ92 TaxID=3378798 RepID=UPI0038552792
MVETLCASDLPTDTDNRWLWSGGEGTLAPAEALMVSSFGGGARAWSFSRGAHHAHEANALVSLARAQRRTGMGLRMVPCNGPFMNMLTPGGSEEFAGWSGVTPGMVAGPAVGVEPVYSTQRVPVAGTVLEPGTVLDEDTILTGPGWGTAEVSADESVYPGTTLLLPGGSSVTSPVVPLLGGFTAARFGAFVRRTGGLGTLGVTMEAVNAAGSVVMSSTGPTATGTTLRRVVWEWDAITHSSAAGVRFRFAPTVSHVIAWPSITLGDQRRRWFPGQAAESVVLSPPSHSPILLTPERSLISTGYTAREDGV